MLVGCFYSSPATLAFPTVGKATGRAQYRPHPQKGASYFSLTVSSPVCLLKPGLVLNLLCGRDFWSSCLSFLTTGVSGVHNYFWLMNQACVFYLDKYSTAELPPQPHILNPAQNVSNVDMSPQREKGLQRSPRTWGLLSVRLEPLQLMMPTIPTRSAGLSRRRPPAAWRAPGKKQQSTPSLPSWDFMSLHIPNTSQFLTALDTGLLGSNPSLKDEVP